MNKKERFYQHPPKDMAIIPNNARTPLGRELLGEIKRIAKLSEGERLKKRRKRKI